MFHSDILARTGRSCSHLKCRGITSVIKELYFPEYRFTYSDGGVIGAPPKKKDTISGMARGRLVDRQVELWIRGGKVNRKKFHPFSRAFIALTERLCLKPVGAQVVVRDESCNIATLVDAVFLDPKGRVVLVELKTGFEGYNETSTGLMHGAFSYMTNCPANQHQVQLAFTQMMFQRTFPEFGTVTALVVRMTSAGAHVRAIGSREKTAVRLAQKSMR